MISFVIPCYNEQGNVEKIYQKIRETFQSVAEPVEIIMVNDGSKDDTMKNLKALKASVNDSLLTIVNFSRNFGKEAAIYAGLTRSKGDYVCVIDADLQQNPSVALEMYNLLKEDPDLDIVGAYQDKRKESALLSFCKKMFYKTVNRMCDTYFQPGVSDFRMMRRSVINAVLSMTEYHRFSKGLFSFVGFNAKYIPYTVEERQSGVSSWSFTKLFRYAIEGIMGYTTKPLVWPLAVGIVSLILSIAAIVVCFVLGATGVGCPSHAIVLSGALFLFSILAIMFGILGMYVAKIYSQGKQRPVYIEKEVITGDSNGHKEQ